MSNADSGNNSTTGPVVAALNTFTPLQADALKYYGFGPEDHGWLREIGVLTPKLPELADMLGRDFSDVLNHDGGGWQECFWLPCREPSGRIIEKFGRAVLIKPPPAFGYQRVPTLSKLAPSKAVAPNTVSFFGDQPWHGYEGEVWIDEDWMKAALAARKGGQMCVALQGINAINFTDDQKRKRLIPQLAAPPWSRKATINIRFDFPSRTSDTSAENTTKAIRTLARALAGKAANIYDASIPEPTDNSDGYDLNEIYKDEGEEAFARILANRRRLPDCGSGGQLHSIAEIASRPPTPWLVHGLVPDKEHMLITGESSCGKTFMALDLAFALALQREEWMGHAIQRTGPVVHVTLEGTGLGNRVRAYMQHYGLSEADFGDRYFSYELPIKIGDNDATRHLLALLTNVQPALVIIDTLNRALEGDENSSQHVGAYLSAIEEMRAACDCAVVSVHHLGKDAGKGARGHSSIAANTGAELRVVHERGTPKRRVDVIKMRDGEAGTSFGWQLDVVPVSQEDTSCVVTWLPLSTSAEAANSKEAIAYRTLYVWWSRRARQPFGPRAVRDSRAPQESGLSQRECETLLLGEWLGRGWVRELSADEARTTVKGYRTDRTYYAFAQGPEEVIPFMGSKI